MDNKNNPPEKNKKSKEISNHPAITNRRVKLNGEPWRSESDGDFYIIQEGQIGEPSENSTYKHHQDATRTRELGEKD